MRTRYGTKGAGVRGRVETLYARRFHSAGSHTTQEGTGVRTFYARRSCRWVHIQCERSRYARRCCRRVHVHGGFVFDTKVDYSARKQRVHVLGSVWHAPGGFTHLTLLGCALDGRLFRPQRPHDAPRRRLYDCFLNGWLSMHFRMGDFTRLRCPRADGGSLRAGGRSLQTVTVTWQCAVTTRKMETVTRRGLLYTVSLFVLEIRGSRR